MIRFILMMVLMLVIATPAFAQGPPPPPGGNPTIVVEKDSLVDYGYYIQGFSHGDCYNQAVAYAFNPLAYPMLLASAEAEQQMLINIIRDEIQEEYEDANPGKTYTVTLKEVIGEPNWQDRFTEQATWIAPPIDIALDCPFRTHYRYNVTED